MHQLYLHIGTPKTGTTSIQHFCHDNLEQLHHFGYDYPDMPYRYPKASLLRNGHFLAGYLHDEQGERDYQEEERRVEEAFALLYKRFEEYDNIILSDEGIWNRSLKEEGLIWKRIRQELQRGLFEIKVIVYIRPQYDYLYSWWNQRVKAGMWFESELTWEQMLQKEEVIQLDYLKVLDQIAKFIGQEHIIVRKFDCSQFVESSLYKDFMHVVGLPLDGDYFISREMHNTSLSRNNSEIKRVLNTLPNLDTQSNAWFREMLLMLSSYKPDRVKYSMFSMDEMQTFREQFREGNRALSKKYFNEDAELFADQLDTIEKWNPKEAELIEDVIAFVGELAVQMYQQNQEMQKQLSQLETKVEKDARRIEGVRNIYRHPVAALGRKIKSVTMQ